MAKYYIFRCRCLKKTPNFTCFSKDVRQRAAIEKHAWALKGDLTAYFSLWPPYFPLISDNNVSVKGTQTAAHMHTCGGGGEWGWRARARVCEREID